MSMTPVENVTEAGTTVFMDGKYFIDCKYTKCTLIYTGGEFGWTDSSFKDCQIRFEGSAQRTAAFMKHFNLEPKKLGQAPPPPASGTVN